MEPPRLLDPAARHWPPWWLRIAAKMVLSRLRLPYRWWRLLGLFRHGDLAGDVERRGLAFALHHGNYRKLTDAPLRGLVEIGPGDSLGLALFAKAAGAEQIWLVDAGDFAVDDPAHYRAILARIAASGLTPPPVAAPQRVSAVLAATGAVYATDGIAALGRLGDATIDLVMSNAALEHLPKAEFDGFLRQHFRILRPGGIGSHTIDLQDHLGGGLNHLRFSERFWECRAVAGSGFYTNRLRQAEICAKARDCGFIVTVAPTLRWPRPTPPRHVLAREFRDLPDDELCIAGFDLILQKPPA